MRKARAALPWGLSLMYVAASFAQTRVNLGKQGVNPDFSAMSGTKVFQTGNSLPGACVPGQSYFKVTAGAGGSLFVCSSANTWTAAILSEATPAEGDVLTWSAATSRWEPAAASVPNYGVAFEGQTSVTIPGSAHQLKSANLLVECYDAAIAPLRRIEPDSVTVDAGTFDVTIGFATPQDGHCVVNGGGAGTTGSSGEEAVNVTAGPGIMVAQSSRSAVVAVDAAVVPAALSALEVVTIGPVPAGGCWRGKVDVAGATVGDAVAAGWPAAFGAFLVGSMWVSEPGAVAAQICNFSGAAVPAWTDTLRATIVRMF